MTVYVLKGLPEDAEYAEMDFIEEIFSTKENALKKKKEYEVKYGNECEYWIERYIILNEEK